MRRYSNAILGLAVVALAFAALPLSAQPVKTKTSAIQVEMIRSDEIKLPAEFQISLYENLVRQLEKRRTLSPAEQAEMSRLKKQKLLTKDRIARLS